MSGGHRRPEGGANGRATAIYIVVGLVITGVLVFAKVSLENTALGQWAERQTFTALTWLLPQFTPGGPAVVVVDIGHIPGGTIDPTTGYPIPTSRSVLLQTIQTLANMQPRAIGVDIDFSPTSGGWVDDGDPSFMRQCMSLSSQTPVVLGVFRGLREPRAHWLGTPEFKGLAAGLWLPTSGLERTPVWTQAPGLTERLPSLGAALASARHGWMLEGPRAGGWIDRFRERKAQSTLRPDGLLVGEVLTNLSVLAQLESGAIRFTDPRELVRHRAHVEGRIVLLGVVEGARDRFRVPGADSDVPGVLIHAASAYTLASEPVWEFSHGARLVLDFGLAVAMMLVVIWLRRGRLGQGHAVVHREEVRVLFWVVAGALVVCAAIVSAFRVFWLDFFVVAFFLVLHPRVSTWLHRMAHRAGGKA